MKVSPSTKYQAGTIYNKPIVLYCVLCTYVYVVKYVLYTASATTCVLTQPYVSLELVPTGWPEHLYTYSYVYLHTCRCCRQKHPCMIRLSYLPSLSTY